jgi:hypothetical protein
LETVTFLSVNAKIAILGEDTIPMVPTEGLMRQWFNTLKRMIWA